VYEVIPFGGITSPKGFLAGSTYCGIKTGGRDLSLVLSQVRCVAAAVYTTNRVLAAPILLTRDHLHDGWAQALIVNSGNANACTGPSGYSDAELMARAAAEKVGISVEDVVVASTGVIGVELPLDKIRAGVEAIVLSPIGGHDAALGIMTTDLVPKEAAVRTRIGGTQIVVGGMAKGSGMIHPNLATMLAFITTDAALDVGFAHQALRRAVDESFNMITVDGDTSTNDMVLLMANGVAGNAAIREGSPEAEVFQEALDRVATDLAKAVVRDGEGASKFIEVAVEGAATRDDARRAARAVAGSNLFKAAVYGSDPNWGRILAAVGYSGAEVNVDKVDISISGISLMQGGLIQQFDRARVSALLGEKDVRVEVNLHLGDYRAVAWGCDLTEEYVRINANYTT